MPWHSPRPLAPERRMPTRLPSLSGSRISDCDRSASVRPSPYQASGRPGVSRDAWRNRASARPKSGSPRSSPRRSDIRPAVSASVRRFRCSASAERCDVRHSRQGVMEALERRLRCSGCLTGKRREIAGEKDNDLEWDSRQRRIDPDPPALRSHILPHFSLLTSHRLPPTRPSPPAG